MRLNAPFPPRFPYLASRCLKLSQRSKKREGLPLRSLWSLWFKKLTCSLASKVNLDHARIVLHRVERAFGEHAALVQHRHLACDARDEGHVVLDHDQRMRAGEREEELRGTLRFLVAHACDRLAEAEGLRLLHEEHADLEPLLLAVREQPGGTIRGIGQANPREGRGDAVALLGGELREERLPHAFVGLHREL